MTRIIAGLAGSLRLEVPGVGTRPTSDRVREAIFSALESWQLIDGSTVLDLYAGSGALGLEALSRGAKNVTLVEKHEHAAKIATRNCSVVQKACGADVSTTVIRKSVQSYLNTLSDAIVFDVVFIDPPYELSEAALAADLEGVADNLHPDGVVLVERSSRSPEPLWPDALRLLRQKRYGETVLWWAERN